MSPHSYALFITGNPGVGKRYIGNHLGARFKSGFSIFGGGVTTNVQKASVNINAHRVLLVDAPGLFEPDEKKTQENAKKITKALKISKDTPLKIGVVVQDHNGRIQHSDLLLIKKVHEALTPQFEMLIIINQIKPRNMWNYDSKRFMKTFVKTIKKHTGAVVSKKHLIAIRDSGKDETPDIQSLIQVLASMSGKVPTNVAEISVSKEDRAIIAKEAVRIVCSIVTTGIFIATATGCVIS